MISCSRPSRSVTRSWTSPAPVTTGRLSSANGPGGTERASRCTLSMNTSTTESWRARPPMVGKGKVTKVGSVPKLVAYWMPAKRTGGAKAPPVGDAVAQPQRGARVQASRGLSVVSSRVTLGLAGQVLAAGSPTAWCCRRGTRRARPGRSRPGRARCRPGRAGRSRESRRCRAPAAAARPASPRPWSRRSRPAAPRAPGPARRGRA